MWSWTDYVSTETKEFASYDHRIQVYHLYDTPLGEVYVKQTHCPDAADLLYEITEYSKVEGVVHPFLAECWDWRVERQEDGSGEVYEIYPKQGETMEVDIRKRCMDRIRHYSEEYLWRTLKSFIDMHALLQSKVMLT